VLESILLERGFLSTRPLFYTLGGSGENGGGMPETGIEALTRAAAESGVEIFRSASLWKIIERKMSLITPSKNGAPDGVKANWNAPIEARARLVVSIGGALSNLGRGETAIALRNGLLFEKDAPAAEDGVIALSLKQGIPVLHLLNLRSLAERSGIDYKARRPFFIGRSLASPLAGVMLFVLILATHRRWSWEER
jgi:poly-gamma-glutamate system protein